MDAIIRYKIVSHYGTERSALMKRPIIDIPRASDSLIEKLIEVGILIVTENGIKAADVEGIVKVTYTI